MQRWKNTKRSNTNIIESIKKKNFHKSARSRKCRNFKNRNQRKAGGKKIRSNEKETLRIMNFNDKNRTINKERNNKVQRTNIIDGNVVKSIISKKEYYREQRKKRNLYKRREKWSSCQKQKSTRSHRRKIRSNKKETVRIMYSNDKEGQTKDVKKKKEERNWLQWRNSVREEIVALKKGHKSQHNKKKWNNIKIDWNTTPFSLRS